MKAAARSEAEATANARPCDETVLTHLDLSRPPTEAELIAAGNLGKKLTPTRSAEPGTLSDPAAKKRQEIENLDFGTAIQAWNEHRYITARTLFEEFLTTYPDSPWAAESMLHIGCYLQYNARFGESAEWFDKAIAASGESSEMLHKAKLRRAVINIDLGRLDEASKSLAETRATNTDPNENTYASYWIMQTAFLKKHEAALRDCGQKALSKAAEILGDADTAKTLANLPSAGTHGFTAAELYTTALQHGQTPHPVQAALALDQLPVPFIAHYKDKHYVTVESVSKDAVRLYDSRISASTKMPRAAFEKEWSGFAMTMGKTAPSGENIHPATNLENISGGCCGIDRLVSDLGKDGCDKKNCGLPGYSVNPISMNFKVIDTPMWWDAPVGPDVNLTLLFNSQDSQNNYIPFGDKWSFEYCSYLMITPGTGVQVRDGDGKIEAFSNPSGGTGTYPITYSNPADFRVLKQTSENVFTLTHQDGTVYHYAFPTAWINPDINPTPPPPGYVPPPISSVPLLVKIEDRHANKISLAYNSNGALIRIEHSALPGSVWSLVYSNIGTKSRVARIDDPFGRSAHFGYDAAGNLTSQTDMGGLKYSYEYSNTAAGLFVTAITTPTGTTTVYTEPADGTNNTIDARSYPQADTNKGYSLKYPLPGRIMWDNYRITVRDHSGNPTEYFYDGYGGGFFLRTPAQMQRSPGANISPQTGSRRRMDAMLVAGRGMIHEVNEYDEDGFKVGYGMNSGYNTQNRLPRLVWNGHAQDSVTYNAQGRPTLIKRNGLASTDHHTTYTYQPDGIDIDTVTRPLNGVTQTLLDYNYFPNRDIQSVTDANGRTLSFLWNSKGLLAQLTDSATSDVTVFAYDANHRPYSVSVNGSIVATTGYDLIGNLLQAQGADSRLFQYNYDGLNRLTRESGPDDSFTAYDWACCFIETVRSGKLVNGVEKNLRRTVTLHDKRALPIVTTETDGSVTRYTYDVAGRLIKLTDPRNQTTEWIYKASDQLKTKKYPDNTVESHTYDSYGRATSFTNRRNQKTWLSYDSIHGKLYRIDPPESLTTLNRDTWGRISTIVQSSGTGITSGTHTFGYDLLGRVTSIDGPWANDTISYTYNDATRSVTRTSPGGMSQTTTANAAGQVASISNILGTFTSAYDGLGGPLTQITHTGTNSGFNTTFTYLGDEFNRALESITSFKPGGAIIAKHTYGYNPLGNIQSWKREAQLANPTGNTSQYQSTIYYDSADQLSSLINQPLAGSTVAHTGHHYTYDPADNIASKQVETSGTGATMTTYSHNTLNQLTSIGGAGGVKPVMVRGDTDEPATVKVKPGIATEWKDARMLEGNRFEAGLDLATGSNEINIQAKDGSNNVSNYTYGLNLVAATAAVPSYDLDGNLLTDGVHSYEWDSQSRLIKITWGAGSDKTTEYRYNGLGQRGERIEKTGTTETAHYYYLYEGINFLCRYTGGTATTNIDRQYLSQGEQRKNGAVWDRYYYTRDHLGSIREVMNSDGSLTARYDYDPYGKRLIQYQADNYTDGCDLGYTGHITQQSAVSGQGEMVLTLFRTYDPELGRWLSADPLGEMGGMNLYAYCYGNPLNLRDPDGRFPSAAWWGGFFDFDQGTVDALGVGAMATADGFIPFADPFQDSGGYDPCQDGVGFSKAAGGIARDAALAAVVPNIGAFAKNPVMYELGSTTVPTRVFNTISHLDPIGRGRALTQMNGGGLGGMVKTALGTSWKHVGSNPLSTMGTGLTPAGNLTVIGGIHIADEMTNDKDCP